MLLGLNNILTEAEVAEVRGIAKKGSFVGAETFEPGLTRVGVIKIEELAKGDPGKARVNEIVLDALYRNETFRTAAIPKHIHTPLLSRYKQGMFFGPHVDNPIMEWREPFRIDMSMTIFLNPPETYEGGELTLETGYGQKSMKLPAGDGILYPTTMQHWVNEVKRGERLCAIVWLQSLVADQAKRQILYDLALTTNWMRQAAPESPEYRRLNQTRANLIRMWAGD